MIITGEIKEVSKTSFTVGEKLVHQQLIRVEYTFYRYFTPVYQCLGGIGFDVLCQCLCRAGRAQYCADLLLADL